MCPMVQHWFTVMGGTCGLITMNQCWSTFGTEWGDCLGIQNTMGCRGRAFGACSRFIMGCFGKNQKCCRESWVGTRLGKHKDKEIKKGYLHANSVLLKIMSGHTLHILSTIFIIFFVGGIPSSAYTSVGWGLNVSKWCGITGQRVHWPGWQQPDWRD